MRALLIVAHGSRRDESNAEVRRLAAAVAAQPNMPFADIRAAFLELAEPSIPDGLVQCAQAGATEVVVFPYFLAAGRHVATDIPEEVAKFTAIHPDVSVTITRHLGESAALPGMIMEVVRG